MVPHHQRSEAQKTGDTRPVEEHSIQAEQRRESREQTKDRKG